MLFSIVAFSILWLRNATLCYSVKEYVSICDLNSACLISIYGSCVLVFVLSCSGVYPFGLIKYKNLQTRRNTRAKRLMNKYN